MAGDISEGWNGVPVAVLLPQNSTVPGVSQDVVFSFLPKFTRLDEFHKKCVRLCICAVAVTWCMWASASE